MGEELQDVDLMMHILNNLPASYNLLVNSLEDELSAMPTLTVMRMKMKLKAKYLCQKGKNGNDKKDSALTSTGGKSRKHYQKNGIKTTKIPASFSSFDYVFI